MMRQLRTPWRDAPKFWREGDWNWADPADNRALDDYYGVTGMPVA
jgi:hypothetical protein